MKILIKMLPLIPLILMLGGCSTSDARTAYNNCIKSVENIHGLERLKKMNDCFRDHRF